MEDTKEKILNTAYKIAGEQGFHKITVRKIAKEAGVNVAAVNYHFRNKENLLRETVLVFVTTMQELIDQLFDGRELNPQNFEEILMKITEKQLENPGIIKSIYISLIRGDVPFKNGEQTISKIFNDLVAATKNKVPFADENSIRIIFVQIFAEVLYPVLLGNFVKTVFQIDYTDQETRRKYIKTIINKNLPGGDLWKN